MYLVLNVEGRSGIRIHPGNFAGDVSKGYRSDFLGCIGFGRSVIFKNKQFMVLQSANTVRKLERFLGHQDFTLTITEEGYTDGL